MKLEFKNVTKQYGEVNAVNKVNCVMEKGERSICHAGRRELCRSSRAAAAAGTAEKLVERYSTSCRAA